MPSPPTESPTPIRACDGCTLCCKVVAVDELEKPNGVWCRHCEIGKGCSIHATRPSDCRTFYCGYLLYPTLDERWKPSEARFVLMTNAAIPRIVAQLDAQRPDAWRREPYYSTLKGWSRSADRSNLQVLACMGRRTWVIFPDREVDLGVVEADEMVITRRVPTAGGMTYHAEKIHRDDPCAASVPRQS